MGKYEIILYWSNEDKVVVAEVPELPGCMAHGKTEEIALRKVKEAINLCIDTAKEFGDFQNPRAGSLCMRSPKYLQNFLAIHSKFR